MSGRKRGYQAAWKVEKWRPQAEQLRREDPELYERILGEASGDAAAAAQRDPEAFVALWLEAASSVTEEDMSGIEDMIEIVRGHLLEMEAEAGGQARFYPSWAMRQFVKAIVIAEAATERTPTVDAASDDPTPEKAQYEAVLDRVLQEEGLAHMAEEVLAAVAYSPEEWEALGEDERRDALERPRLGDVLGGERGSDASDRPLSERLYERDPQQYQIVAAQLMQATAHAVPEVARQLYFQLIGPLVDRKTIDKYGQWLRDTFECGYVLCVSETWEGLDSDLLRTMIEDGLRRVIAEKDTRDPGLLLNDSEYRIRNVSYGIVGDMPYFAQLNEYLGEQGAFLRIGGLGDFFINQALSGGLIKGRRASGLQSPLYMSFMLGISLGLLDQLGEVPATMPTRLP